MVDSPETEISITIQEGTTVLLNLSGLEGTFRIGFGGAEGKHVRVYAELLDDKGRCEEIYDYDYTRETWSSNPADAVDRITLYVPGMEEPQVFTTLEINDLAAEEMVGIIQDPRNQAKSTPVVPAMVPRATGLEGRVTLSRAATSTSTAAPATAPRPAMLPLSEAPRDGTKIRLTESTTVEREYRGFWQSSFGRQGWVVESSDIRLTGLCRDETFKGWRPE